MGIVTPHAYRVTPIVCLSLFLLCGAEVSRAKASRLTDLISDSSCSVCKDDKQCCENLRCLDHRCVESLDKLKRCAGSQLCEQCETIFDCRFGLCIAGFCVKSKEQIDECINHISAHRAKHKGEESAVLTEGANSEDVDAVYDSLHLQGHGIKEQDEDNKDVENVSEEHDSNDNMIGDHDDVDDNGDDEGGDYIGANDRSDDQEFEGEYDDNDDEGMDDDDERGDDDEDMDDDDDYGDDDNDGDDDGRVGNDNDGVNGNNNYDPDDVSKDRFAVNNGERYDSDATEEGYESSGDRNEPESMTVHGASGDLGFSIDDDEAFVEDQLTVRGESAAYSKRGKGNHKENRKWDGDEGVWYGNEDNDNSSNNWDGQEGVGMTRMSEDEGLEETGEEDILEDDDDDETDKLGEVLSLFDLDTDFIDTHNYQGQVDDPMSAEFAGVDSLSVRGASSNKDLDDFDNAMNKEGVDIDEFNVRGASCKSAFSDFNSDEF